MGVAGVALTLVLGTACGSDDGVDSESTDVPTPRSAAATVPSQPAPAPAPAPAAPQPLPLPGAPLSPPRLDTAIEGTVAFRNGQPLVGARVLMVSASVLVPRTNAQTDTAGRYRIEGLREGTFTLAVISREGKQLGRESAEVAEGETSELDFVVEGEPAGTIEGRVTDAGGNGLGGLRVFIESDTAIFKDDPTRTNEDGSFSLGSVALGSREVLVIDSIEDVVASLFVFVQSAEVAAVEIVVSDAQAVAAASSVELQTCRGVFDEPPPTLTLQLIRAENAPQDDPSVVSMCVAAVQSVDEQAKGTQPDVDQVRDAGGRPSQVLDAVVHDGRRGVRRRAGPAVVSGGRRPLAPRQCLRSPEQ